MQIIAGIVEHRISEEFSSQTLLVNMLSFIARTINSYWGTQVRVVMLISHKYLKVLVQRKSTSYQRIRCKPSN